MKKIRFLLSDTLLRISFQRRIFFITLSLTSHVLLPIPGPYVQKIISTVKIVLRKNISPIHHTYSNRTTWTTHINGAQENIINLTSSLAKLNQNVMHIPQKISRLNQLYLSTRMYMEAAKQAPLYQESLLHIKNSRNNAQAFTTSCSNYCIDSLEKNSHLSSSKKNRLKSVYQIGIFVAKCQLKCIMFAFKTVQNACKLLTERMFATFDAFSLQEQSKSLLMNVIELSHLCNKINVLEQALVEASSPQSHINTLEHDITSLSIKYKLLLARCLRQSAALESYLQCDQKILLSLFYRTFKLIVKKETINNYLEMIIKKKSYDESNILLLAREVTRELENSSQFLEHIEIPLQKRILSNIQNDEWNKRYSHIIICGLLLLYIKEKIKHLSIHEKLRHTSNLLLLS